LCKKEATDKRKRGSSRRKKNCPHKKRCHPGKIGDKKVGTVAYYGKRKKTSRGEKKRRGKNNIMDVLMEKKNDMELGGVPTLYVTKERTTKKRRKGNWEAEKKITPCWKKKGLEGGMHKLQTERGGGEEEGERKTIHKKHARSLGDGKGKRLPRKRAVWVERLSNTCGLKKKKRNSKKKKTLFVVVKGRESLWEEWGVLLSYRKEGGHVRKK